MDMFSLKRIALVLGASMNSIHLRFTQHRLFGPLAFGLLTVSLLLPPFGGASTDAIKYAMLLFSASLVCFSIRNGMEGFTVRWVNIWVFLFILWVTVTTVFARDSLFAFIGAYPRYNSSWFLYTFFAGTVWLCVYLGGGFRATIERLILAIGFCVAAFGLLQTFGVGFYGGIAGTLAPSPDRVPSLVGNPNFSSWFVAAILPFALLYVCRTTSFVRRIGWIFYIFISIWSVVVFSSRGAIAAMVVGCVVFTVCAAAIRQWRVAIAVALFGFLAFGLFSGYYKVYRPQQSDSFLVLQDTSSNDRYVAWALAGQLWSEHAWLGIGPGNFDQYYWEHLPTTRMAGDQYFDDPHNVPLSVLVDMGLPGFALFAFLLAMVGAKVVRLLFRARELDGWVAATAGMSAWFVAGLFNPAVIALWVLLAVLVAHVVGYMPGRRVVTVVPRLAVVGWRLGGVALCVLAVGLIVGEYALVYSIALESYHKYPQAVRQQSQVTRLAALVEPYNMEVRYAAVFTDIRAGVPAETLRKEIESVFSLHPYSTRSGLIAAQLTADLWYRDQKAGDLAAADTYLHTALQRSSGYPVVESWAAIFYWRTGRPDLAKRYAHYATYKQPRYLDNWLLLAKIYREQNNLRAMEYALEKAQELTPGNLDLAKMRKQLREAQDVRAVELRPGEATTITRLH